ncbi:Dienelactone hydrolase [Penicillium concentricum]|uniref:Dienelactone hydrolase n=1 Tax=Penicillium concentricum TaxID=293559 RepID=A0A9W9VA69_9EURO|nr:Dienelactone hydrolase [Penicillium concentricum]KAJ5373269.1 Dienelactone hydrolase [Penicillium concentricum]
MSCPDCFSGYIHQGTPRGEVTSLHGLPVYTTKPLNDAPYRGILIVVPDAFGWEFVNNRIVADNYAEKGKYLVYLPEFMNGHAAPTDMIASSKQLFGAGGLTGWLVKPYYLVTMLSRMLPFVYHNKYAVSGPVVRDFFKSVRENEGAELPVYGAGFCWGGMHIVNLAAGADVASNGKPLLDAGFTGHPSFLEIPTDIERIKIPVSFALGSLDMVVKPPQIEQIKQVFASEAGAKNGEVVVYEGAGHGFCVRGDFVQEDASKQADEAENQALAWFAKH